MKKVLMLMFITFSGVVSAHDGNDGWVSTNGFTLWSNTYTSPEIRVETKDGYYNPKNCTDPDSYMVSSTLPVEVQQRIYSTMLSAVVANKTIRLRIDADSCEGSKPKILNVTIN